MRKELHIQCRDRCAYACAGDLLESVIDESVEDLANEVYRVDVVARREELDCMDRAVKLVRLSRWFHVSPELIQTLPLSAITCTFFLLFFWLRRFLWK